MNQVLLDNKSSDRLLISLIKKELQDARIVNELARMGFSSTHFGPALGEVIFTLLGIENRDDDLWEWYYQTLDAHANQVEMTDLSNLEMLAREFAGELSLRGR